MDQNVESGYKLYVVCQRDIARNGGYAALEETGYDESHYKHGIDAAAQEESLSIADALENTTG